MITFFNHPHSGGPKLKLFYSESIDLTLTRIVIDWFMSVIVSFGEHSETFFSAPDCILSTIYSRQDHLECCF